MDYGDDPFYSKGGMWQRQLHIFLYPFYYIDYCLASICAMQFKVRMDEDYQDAWNRYLALCKNGGKVPFVENIAKAGLENPFEDGCVEKLVEKLSQKIFKK